MAFDFTEIKKPEGPILFIDDTSKRLFQADELDNVQSHLTKAFWVPALGYNAWDGHVYVAGATGAGKSYLIRKMINNDKKKRKCILFTDLKNDDPAFDGMNVEKYDTKEHKDPLESEWLRQQEPNKILIFDDVQFNTAQIKYRDFMLEKGRHLQSVVICVNHKLQDYYQTKVPLNDAKYVITFPCANKGSVIRYLKNELEMNRKFMDDILDIALEEGRHLIIHKHSPNCIATTESIFKV